VPVNILHKSFRDQITNPSLAPINACLPEKKDRALRLSVLAACLCHGDVYPSGPSTLSSSTPTVPTVDQSTLQPDDTPVVVTDNYHDDDNVFRFIEKMYEVLKRFGISNPEASVKEGGVGGHAVLKPFVKKFLYSARGQCPATASVLGALVSQEVVKLCTHTLMPLSQMLVFESLDSVSVEEWGERTGDQGGGRLGRATRPNGSGQREGGSGEVKRARNQVELVYGTAVAEELRRLRVLLVGCGAIGCEHLKNLALMGVGEGSRGRSSTGHGGVDEEGGHVTSGDTVGIYDGYLSDGGIVVTDMDSIEMSNLNRQLLFR